MTILKEQFINKNKYTRPGYKLKAVRGIVLHYTANPGAGAQNHYKFFGNGGGSRYAGAHIFIDKTEALLIVPLNEVCYHANEKTCKVQKLKATTVLSGKTYHWDANLTTIGIEMCIEKDGSIHPDTLAKTIAVTAELMKKFNLTVNDLYRHYDITTKACPKPWVDAPVEWTRFKNSVVSALQPAKEEEKKASAPAATVPTNSTSPIGFVSIIANNLNVRSGASFTASATGTVGKGAFFKVYETKNGLHRIGENKWVSAGAAYTKFFKYGSQIGVATLKTWSPAGDTLNVRDKASLSGKVVNKLKQKTAWKVYDYTEDFVRVGKDQWISRNDKYVTLKFG